MRGVDEVQDEAAESVVAEVEARFDASMMAEIVG